jgi:hypothetical protein
MQFFKYLQWDSAFPSLLNRILPELESNNLGRWNIEYTSDTTKWLPNPNFVYCNRIYPCMYSHYSYSLQSNINIKRPTIEIKAKYLWAKWQFIDFGWKVWTLKKYYQVQQQKLKSISKAWLKFNKYKSF